MSTEYLLRLIPEYYHEDPVVLQRVGALSDERNRILSAIIDVFNQMFINTSTWSIDDWEDEFDIPHMPAEPIESRRSRIVSKLRGFGTATIKVVKAVAESYDHGKINVIEDHPAYRVIIQFADTTGIPPLLDELKAALRAVVPAHLTLEYEFNYFIWQELDDLGWTWDALDALGLTWDQLEVYA